MVDILFVYLCHSRKVESPEYSRLRNSAASPDSPIAAREPVATTTTTTTTLTTLTTTTTTTTTIDI